MKKLWSSLACLALACTPEIANTPPPSVITARFDPSAKPPVVSAPNDLATDPKTGLLAVPLTGSDADVEFYGYLNTLDGFPASSGASTTFDGELADTSVGASSVKVFDVTDANKPITPAAIVYSKTGDTTAPGRIDLAPPMGGWTPGHSYAVAIIGGGTGVKGGDTRPVVASPTFAFLRSEKPLVVNCDNPANPNCRAATEIIPSDIKDSAAARLADQTGKALQLEGLRLKYKPIIDAVIAGGTARADIAIVWSFKISDFTQMAFDPAATPPSVPLPNNLAIDPSTGLVKAPIDPTSSPAQQEFTSDYLNTLNGFPVSATASSVVIGGDLDPASINSDPTAPNVFVLSLAGGDLAAQPTVAYDATAKQLTLTPAGGSWGKGKTLAVVVMGGAAGVVDTNGGPVVGTPTWALVRSAASLVSCDDLKAALVACATGGTVSTACNPAITAAPVTTCQAAQLEALRAGYAPILDGIEANGGSRQDVALLWVFSTVDQPEATFDPANSIIPFPNNLLINPTTGNVALPIPAGAPPLLAALVGGLNTLDGFSLTAPIVSENSDVMGALDEDNIDPASLDGGTTGFVKLQGAGTLSPKVKVCLSCASTTLADGGTVVLLPDGGAIIPAPQQLQFVPQVALEEKTNYAGWITTKLQDTKGRSVIAAPAFALLRSKASLVDNGKSTISGVSDANAAALEPARLGLKPMFDALDAAGVKRKDLALAFSFKTQSAVSILGALNGVPNLIGTLGGAAGAATAFPTGVGDITAVARPQLTAGGIPNAAIGKIFQANIILPFILTNTGGTLNPTAAGLQDPRMPRRAPMLITTPATPTPAGGFPILVFGHGLGRTRTDMFAFANTAAQFGFATVAIDAVLHGDRSDCVGFGASRTPAVPDDAACADPTTQKCSATSGRCIARTTGAACTFGTSGDFVCQAQGQGMCLPTATGAPGPSTCEGGDFKRDATGAAAIGAWNYLDLVNLFATRDHFRYAPLDNAQLLRVVKQAAAGGASLRERLIGQDPNAVLDITKIHYAGQSLGGLNGALTASVNADLQNVGLNVPAADQVTLLLASPTLAPQRAGFLGLLGSLGLIPGTPAFDQFIGLARMIIDPADPLTAIHTTVNSTAVGRKTYIQYIENDQFVINPTTLELLADGSQTATKPFLTYFQPPAGYPLAKRHGFMLDPTGDANCATAGAPPLFNGCLTAQAQFKMGNFLLTGTQP